MHLFLSHLKQPAAHELVFCEVPDANLEGAKISLRLLDLRYDGMIARKLPSFIKDTTDLLNRIELINNSGPFPEGTLLVSWDVVSKQHSLALAV